MQPERLQLSTTTFRESVSVAPARHRNGGSLPKCDDPTVFSLPHMVQPTYEHPHSTPHTAGSDLTDSSRVDHTFAARWFCVHTKPRQEAQVSHYLRENLGLEIYLPRLREHRTIRRVRRVVTKPLFPRYLFCRFDAGLQYRAVRHAPDVLDVVRFGQQPAPVSDAIIEELRTWAGTERDIITIDDGFNVGDVVTIKAGPMRGLQAVISQARSDRDRVAILLSTLEYQAQVLISRSLLELAG